MVCASTPTVGVMVTARKVSGAKLAGVCTTVFMVRDGELDPVQISDLYGPVETQQSSPWFMGAERGTNQTGELCGVMQALLWLLHQIASMQRSAGWSAHDPAVAAAVRDSPVVIGVDSLYAINQIEGHWKANKNEELIERGRALLVQVRKLRDIHFVHVKGHSGDAGNDRADLLVQWGKTEGPYSRYRMNGVGEGDGRNVALSGHLRKVHPAGAVAAHTVLVLGDDQSTTDDEPEQMSSESEAELIELLQAGMDKET